MLGWWMYCLNFNIYTSFPHPNEREDMKTTIKVEKEVEIAILYVEAGVRYWEDSTVNDVSDDNGDLIPCRNGDVWCPEIDVNTGKILNWKEGTTAEIHYKVCDSGTYILRDSDGNAVSSKEGYVPSCLCPKEGGYGDYIIMDISADGTIKDWSFDQEDAEGLTAND
jgi:WD40 repeat protein